MRQTDQPPLDFSVHTHAPRGAHDTEIGAAAAALENASEACRRVYDTIREAGPDGLTHEEMVWKTGLHSARRRCADLKRAGLVIDSGERRLTRQGRTTIVWRVEKAVKG